VRELRSARISGQALWRGLCAARLVKAVDALLQLRLEDEGEEGALYLPRTVSSGSWRSAWWRKGASQFGLVGAGVVEDDMDVVRRQSFWENGLGKIREALAHQFGDFRRTAPGAANGGWRWSVV
jgi:hypothetical protein